MAAKKRKARKRRKAPNYAGRNEIRQTLLEMAQEQNNNPIVGIWVSYKELRRRSTALDRMHRETLVARLEELHQAGDAWVADRKERQRGFDFRGHGLVGESRWFRVVLLSPAFHQALGFVPIHDHAYMESVANVAPHAQYWLGGGPPPVQDYGPPPPARSSLSGTDSATASDTDSGTRSGTDSGTGSGTPSA